MFGLGFGEILVIAAILLVVVGPERLPVVMRHAGRIYGQVRRASDELRRAFVLEADRVDAEARYEELKKRREEARRRAEEMKEEAKASLGPAAQQPAFSDEDSDEQTGEDEDEDAGEEAAADDADASDVVEAPDAGGAAEPEPPVEREVMRAKPTTSEPSAPASSATGGRQR